VGRDLAIADLSGTQEQIQTLKDLHRRGEWERALSRYPEILKGLIQIRYRYPGLSPHDDENIQRGIAQLVSIESIVDRARPNIPGGAVSDWNQELTQVQLTLAELANHLR
jgi:hypothetical protein